MTVYRYPEEVGSLPPSGGTLVTPYVHFRPFIPRYEGNNKIISTYGEDDVILHMPLGYTVSDAMSYDTHLGGLTQVMINAGVSSMDAVSGLDSMTQEEFGNALTASGDVVQTLGDELLPMTIGNSIIESLNKQARRRGAQRGLNPREYIMFREMPHRMFMMNFTFLPKSKGEADVIPEIIRFFRYHSYPGLSADKMSYDFPHQFIINIKTTGTENNIIKIPKVACVSVSTTYNPISMSYFKDTKFPIHTNISLTFQELEPITTDAVRRGF
jgi:hypothetical protein